MSAPEREAALSPFALGFYTTLVCECALQSLADGRTAEGGVVLGATVDARQLLRQRVGPSGDTYYR